MSRLSGLWRKRQAYNNALYTNQLLLATSFYQRNVLAPRERYDRREWLLGVHLHACALSTDLLFLWFRWRVLGQQWRDTGIEDALWVFAYMFCLYAWWKKPFCSKPSNVSKKQRNLCVNCMLSIYIYVCACVLSLCFIQLTDAVI